MTTAISTPLPQPARWRSTVAPVFAASVAGALWAALAGAAATAAWVAPGGAGGTGLSAVIAVLTLFVAAIVATFSLRYMRADPRRAGFFATIALLVASVLGFALARDLLTLGAAWCASGLLLARLIGHDQGWGEAKAAAARARRAFIVGDAALLGALALIGMTAGTLRLDGVLAAIPAFPPAITLVAALLMLVAAAARCALPPFAGWLLSSMTAPTPVSALMHAGLVNAGGFLLIRFAPLFEAAPAARAAAIALGLGAAIYGIGVMTVRPDVKRGLAGSTVSQMGFMIMSCGLGAYAAALWHIVAHGLFKAWLFLGSGSAIGAAADKPAATVDQRTAALIALATLIAGAALLQGGATEAAALVPLLLALATAGATLVAGWRAALPGRARLAGAGLLIALIAVHAAGLALMHRMLGADAPALLPAWALLALLAVFLAVWVAQQARAATLPARLYVHLLNAGTVPARSEK